MLDRLAASLIAASPDGMLVVDAAGVISIANPAACLLFGVVEEELVGSSVDRLVPIEHRRRHVGLRESYSDAPTSRPMGTGPRLLAQHADGRKFPVEVSLSPVELDGSMFTIAAVRDVSQRLADAAQLELLRDRERIARDLHDMVIQRLFGAGLGLQAVAGAAEPTMVRERIVEVIDDLDETIRELRGAIFKLSIRPAELPISGRIGQIVHGRTRGMSQPPSIEIDSEVDEISTEIAEQLLATLREAMSNIVRHAGASSCAVVVAVRDGRAQLTVTDDGVGLPELIEHRGGLDNMERRATMLGGSFTATAAPAGGTVIEWSAPT